MWTQAKEHHVGRILGKAALRRPCGKPPLRCASTMRIFHFTSGALLGAAAGCSAGAGGAAVQVPTVTVALPVATSLAVTPVPPPASAIDDYVGRYRISGTPTSDECGNVYLAARHIQVTSSNELRADVVNRI